MAGDDTEPVGRGRTSFVSPWGRAVLFLVAASGLEWMSEWSTPAKLRLLQLLTVAGCLLNGAVAVHAAKVGVDDIRHIENHTLPLTTDALDVYRSLADADASVEAEFLVGQHGESGARSRYDDDIGRAAAALIRAGRRADPGSLSGDRITDVATQLPVYAGVVEEARVHAAVGERDGERDGDGTGALRRASSMMQSTVLRRAESLVRDESQHLDDGYRRAAAFPVRVGHLSVVCLAGLVAVQVSFGRRFRRFFNIGLLVSTVAVGVTVVWWWRGFSAAQDQLASSRRASQAVTDSLGQAQIAALQARAAELLALLTNDAVFEEDYRAKLQRLARKDGIGGALGAARQFGGPAAEPRVAVLLTQTRAWVQAHDEVRKLAASGFFSDAIMKAVDTGRAGAGHAFAALDGTLGKAIATESTASGDGLARARRQLSRLHEGSAALGVVAVLAAWWGTGRRLAEYR